MFIGRETVDKLKRHSLILSLLGRFGLGLGGYHLAFLKGSLLR